MRVPGMDDTHTNRSPGLQNKGAQHKGQDDGNPQALDRFANGKKLLIRANDVVAADLWREIQDRLDNERMRNMQYFTGQNTFQAIAPEKELIGLWRWILTGLDVHPYKSLLEACGITVHISPSLAGYMRVLKAPLLHAFPGRIMNVHPSLLPAFPGLRAWEQALKHGVKVTGCTVHFVEEGLDSGPIVSQAAVPVLAEDTVESLSARILKEEHRVGLMARSRKVFQQLSKLLGFC